MYLVVQVMINIIYIYFFKIITLTRVYLFSTKNLYLPLIVRMEYNYVLGTASQTVLLHQPLMTDNRQNWWNDTWHGKANLSSKICPSTTL
jgi:hypothetical protein